MEPDDRRVVVGRDSARAIVYDAERMSIARLPRSTAERVARYERLGHGELEIEPSDLETWRKLDAVLARDRPVTPLDTPVVVTKLALGNTYHCNMGCTYCYNELDLKDRKGSAVPTGMSHEVARASVDALFAQAADSRALSLVFVGGEPLLEREVMEDAVRHARSRASAEGRSLSIVVYTNATLMTERVVDWAAEYDVSLIVSLDGPPSVHDRRRIYLNGRPTSRIILKNVRRMVESGTQSPLRVRGVASSSSSLVALHRYFLDLGFNEIHVQPAYGEHGIDEIADGEMLALLDWYRDLLLQGTVVSVMPFDGFLERMLLRGAATASWYPCSAGRNYLGVAPDGRVYPCHHFLEEQAFEMGDVRSGLPKPAERSRFYQRVDEREPCRSCWARHACGGECYHRAHAAGVGYTGTLPDVCRRRKGVIGATLEVLADLSVQRPDVLARLTRRQLSTVTPNWDAYEHTDLSPYG